MKTIYADVIQLLEAGQRFALATVVHTRGSTPQKPGAQALFLPDGRVLGTIGGGCMEAEARLRALDSIKAGDRALFEMNLDEDFGWDDGHMCGGAAKIFLDSQVRQSAAVLRATVAAATNQRRAVLATIVQPPPQSPPATARGESSLKGARLLLESKNVQGGDGESTCEILAADEGVTLELQFAIATTATAVVKERRETTKQVVVNDAEYSVYFEPLLPKPALLICGGGHVGTALCKLGAFLGFDVTVVDDRPEFANPQRQPEALATICDDVVKSVRNFNVTPDTYIVIVTRGHRNDAQVLREVLHSPAAYVGMIGSKRKTLVMRDAFLEEGVATAQDFERVHAPVGLDIGSETVEEIALSIAAELVLVRTGVERNVRVGGIKKLSDAIRERTARTAGGTA